jgi:glycosyltransferase involved in cell wall biosynthesis
MWGVSPRIGKGVHLVVGGSIRVALVHDWLTGMRGGEKVLEIFANLFPQAPIYTLVHEPGSVSPAIESHPIITSSLQKVPGAVHRYRHFLPVMPWLMDRQKIEPVDLVLSCSSCVAKSAVAPRGAQHASYILSPMRYIYDRYDDYFSPSRAGILTRLAMRGVRRPLQQWDRATSRRADSMVAISTFIAERIRQVYGREAPVIFPPVNIDRFAPAMSPPDDYYLMVTALVPYKNVDLAVEAFRSLDRRLIVAGSGPMLARLRESAPPNVTFLGWVEDEAIPTLVGRCRAFLMPNVEDFGIAPIEAMAAGRPVIALGEGGVRDTVLDLDRWNQGQLPPRAQAHGPTGLFFDQPRADSLATAIQRFEKQEACFDPASIARWAATFGEDRFRREIQGWIGSLFEQARTVAA